MQPHYEVTYTLLHTQNRLWKTKKTAENRKKHETKFHENIAKKITNDISSELDEEDKACFGMKQIPDSHYRNAILKNMSGKKRGRRIEREIWNEEDREGKS